MKSTNLKLIVGQEKLQHDLKAPVQKVCSGRAARVITWAANLLPGR